MIINGYNIAISEDKLDKMISEQMTDIVLIDENFEYTVYCQEHIKEVNEVLEVYRDILTSSKVRLSK